ncbi:MULTISPECIES: 2-oxo acid dehydrogenase subunit E2 [Microbacterium]|uniref:2-oxo acid dehydrogenase subunit E2 n=1 Tax=Microbacterium TaxID=33882 RepID=UPI000D6482CC|nr:MULTISPECIES: 2-oxo acid dehydrogenase subunit E2 [Microbacterium]
MDEKLSHEDSRVETVPLKGMRGAIAHAMLDSLQNTAQLTLHREYDADGVIAWRRTFPDDARPTLNDLVLMATARVLRDHAELNATIDEDARQIHRHTAVHLGMAVAPDRGGLVVPVIRNADRMTLPEITAAASASAASAKQGRLTMAEISGGTFTVTNLGSFGVDFFTPVVQRPQVAILGVGRMRGDRSTLSLTIDHRAVDGVPGGRFLNDLAVLLQDPAALAHIAGTTEKEF